MVVAGRSHNPQFLTPDVQWRWRSSHFCFGVIEAEAWRTFSFFWATIFGNYEFRFWWGSVPKEGAIKMLSGWFVNLGLNNLCWNQYRRVSNISSKAMCLCADSLCVCILIHSSSFSGCMPQLLSFTASQEARCVLGTQGLTQIMAHAEQRLAVQGAYPGFMNYCGCNLGGFPESGIPKTSRVAYYLWEANGLR